MNYELLDICWTTGVILCLQTSVNTVQNELIIKIHTNIRRKKYGYTDYKLAKALGVSET